MKRKIQYVVIITILSIFELKSFEYQYPVIKSDSNILGININRSTINIKTFAESNKNIELDNVNCKYNIDNSDISSVSSFSEDLLNQNYIYNPFFNKTKIEEKLDKNYTFEDFTNNINNNNEHENFFKTILMQGIEDINIYYD